MTHDIATSYRPKFRSNSSGKEGERPLVAKNININTTMIVFSILDSGLPLSDLQMEEMFFPPMQTHRNDRGGLGVGMYTLASRVRALGGTFGFQRRIDGSEGNEVWFAIPIDTFTSKIQQSKPEIKTIKNNLIGNTPPLKESSEATAHMRGVVSSTEHVPLTDVSRRSSSEFTGRFPPVFTLRNNPTVHEEDFTRRMKGMSALVVDDAISISKMVAFVLKKAGVNVKQAENGQDALDLMLRETFDFVIMDI